MDPWCRWDLLKKSAIGRFELGSRSDHGPEHWRRVERNGLWICSQTGADPTVARLFAWLHDCCRQNESSDPEHGWRAAQFAATLRGKVFDLDEREFDQLIAACDAHADGDVSDDPMIGACWDANRLDLGRVGMSPLPEMMSTEPGRAAAAGEAQIAESAPGPPEAAGCVAAKAESGQHHLRRGT